MGEPLFSTARCRCQICDRYVRRNPRLGSRQKLCGRPECRQAYKNKWSRDKTDKDAHHREKEKSRVGEWRVKHPDYWKPKAPCVAAVVPVCLAGLEATVVRQQRVMDRIVLHLAKESDGAWLAGLLAVGEPMEREREMAEVVT